MQAWVWPSTDRWANYWSNAGRSAEADRRLLDALIDANWRDTECRAESGGVRPFQPCPPTAGPSRRPRRAGQPGRPARAAAWTAPSASAGPSRATVPRAPAARRRRPGRGLRGRGPGTAPRGGAQGDQEGTRLPTRSAGAGSSWRRRSPAGWSTRGSCRSTGWAPTPTAGPSTPCGSSAATTSRRPSSGSTRPTPVRFGHVAGVPAAAGPVHGRVQGDRVCAQPGRAAPGPEARQHHAGQVRRDAGGGLGPGRKWWAGSDEDVAAREEARCGRVRGAAGQRPRLGRRSGRRRS